MERIQKTVRIPKDLLRKVERAHDTKLNWSDLLLRLVEQYAKKRAK